MLNPDLKLLILCTHLDHPVGFSTRLQNAAGEMPNWNNFPTLAEQHGLAPLAYHHLKTIAENIPPVILRTLKGQALRDRLINQVRTTQVAVIAACFENAGIPLLFLKGAALAHILYPEPGLRPMSDLDLFVDREHLKPACDLLKNLGYQGSAYPQQTAQSRHLPSFSQDIDRFPIGIELHYALLQHPDGTPWFEMKDLSSPFFSFQVASFGRAFTLGREDMLFHLCQHAFFNNSGFDALRLMWVADIVNFSNQFQAEIDWGQVHRLYPSVMHALALLHPLLPLSESLISRAGLDLSSSPAGVGQDFSGWPILPIPLWRQKSYPKVLKETLFPSPWWLQLHYGAVRKAPLWYHWIQHLLNLLGEAHRRRIHANNPD
jgi:hypothetical protein